MLQGLLPLGIVRQACVFHTREAKGAHEHRLRRLSNMCERLHTRVWFRIMESVMTVPLTVLVGVIAHMRVLR